MIPQEVHAEHWKKCKECEHRKVYAKMDFHFDWIDCWLDCPNDYDHYKKQIKESEENE